MKDRIAKSLFWVVWSRGAVQLVSFLSTLVVVRLLNPADYGLMALAGVWIYAIALMAEVGLGAAIVQFAELEDRELNTCFWLAMGMAGIGYLTLYASAPAIAAWFASPMLSEVLRVAGLSLPLVAVRIVPDSLLRKRLELDRVSQAEVASMLATMPVVLGLAWSGAGVWALVAGSLVMPLVQTIVSFWFVRWRPGLRIGSRRLQGILRYSLAALGARVGWAAYQQVDAVVLGKVSGEVVLGFYSMAKLLASLPLEKVTVVANQLALPVMAGFQADRATMRASFLRGLRLVACLTVPMCIGMALVADDFVFVALGEKWGAIVPLLRVLCLLGLIRSVDTLLPPVLLARYRASALFWWTAALLLIMSFAFWAGAAWSGALGVALAWVVVYPVVMAWMAREGLRELELRWTTLWEQLRPIMDAALMMAAAVVAVRWALLASDVPIPLLRLGLAAGLGAVVYGAAIMWRGGPLVGEIAEVAGWLLRRRAAPDRGPSLTLPRARSNVFLFHAGRAYPRLETWALRRSSSVLSKPILKLAKVLEYRRNPRSREYMERLAKEVFTDFDPQDMVVLGDARRLPALPWSAIGQVVLLWPDANGTGWARIVRDVFRRKSPATAVLVLNGRRRAFVLNRIAWAGFTWRQWLERTLALELGFTLAFLVIAPGLTVWDLLRGRR